MRKVSLRNIAAHKLRLALTVLAVVLGTAFISGAFMFTNSLSNSFDAAVNNAYQDVDAVAHPAEGSAGITPEQRQAVAEDPAVAKVNLTENTTVVLARGTAESPEPIQTGSGSADLGVWYAPEDVVGNPRELVEGTAPTNGEEVAVNAQAADQFGISVGEELTVVDPAARFQVTVTGLYERDLDQGTTINLLMPESDFLDRYHADSPTVGELLIDGEGEAQSVVDELAAAHPELTFETGQQLADEVSKTIQDALSFVNYFLVAFGLVALLVGTFLIANTFSMIVAQRTKEFALLRALGASRRQITNSVVLEAVVVGFLGSAIGILVGVGLVAAIKAIMATQGAALPGSGLGLSPMSVVVPLIIGTVVTVISAWAPARRAGQVEPVEAMRSTESATPQPLTVRTILGLVLLVVGVVAGLVGASMDDWGTADRAWAVGGGAIGVIVGFFLAGPALSLPIVPTFGRLIGLPFGSIGKLASTNSRRNPRRTSATAFALALGIALVTVIGMLGQTMKNSIDDLVETGVSAEFVLMPPQRGGFSIPAEVPQTALDVEGVGTVLTYSSVPVAVDGVYTYDYGPGQGASDVISGDPADMVVLDMLEGTSDLGENGVIASKAFAEEHGWGVGDTYELSAPGLSPATTEVEIVGIYDENPILANDVISKSAVDKLGLPAAVSSVAMVGVNGDGTVDPEQLRQNLTDAMNQYIVVQVLSSGEMAGMAGDAVTQMLNILYALLALAIIIAILGIVNTLTLSVIERRQELGMLRAVGSQRGQIRTMIILESVQIAVFGAVAGMAMGLFLGWAFLKALSGTGLESVAIPWSLLGIVLAGSLVVGVLAAILPANRAAKTPPLDAIAD